MIDSLAPLQKVALFVLAYGVVALANAWINWRAFKETPEKGERYRQLPIWFKLGCWCIVMPLFAGIIIEPILAIPAFVSLLLLPAACVRWYRKVGLLPDD